MILSYGLDYETIKGELKKIRRTPRSGRSVAELRVLFCSFLSNTIEEDELFDYKTAEILSDYREFLVNKEDSELDFDAEFIDAENYLLDYVEQLKSQIDDNEWLETANKIQEVFNLI